MEYLVVMSFSGGTITVVYLLLRCLLKRKICARFFDLLARVAILYYLVPLPFLKKCYLAILRLLLPEVPMEISRVPLTWRNHVVYAEGALHVNIYAGIQTAAAIIWVSGVCLLLTVWAVVYVRLSRKAAKYADMAMTPECRDILEALKEQVGIKRPVYLYEAMEGESTITFGFFSPVIVCSRAMREREAELLVQHELVHIRRMDALWKMFMELAAMLHWCNPLVWILRSSFEQVCECSCDEIATQKRTEEEVKLYERLMVEEALEKKTENVFLRWKAGFGNNARKIKERMENLMRKKKWNRVAAVALVAALTFANSMTVFAYREPFEREVMEEVSEADIERKMGEDTFMFVPEGTGAEETQEFGLLNDSVDAIDILYEKQFMDEAGNIYPILEDDMVEPHCNHDFVDGTAVTHRKLSGGGCEVRTYDAQRCSKCGYVIEGALISKTTYVTCPH